MTRLGVYVDDVYHVDAGGRISVDRAFLLFACAVGRRLGPTTVFGRTLRSGAPRDYLLPDVALVPLPHYGDLKHLRASGGVALATARAMWRGLDGVDAVWVFGPHPFGLLLVLFALLRRRRVVLGVRQDTPEYVRARLRDRPRGRRTLLAAAGALDHTWRLLARGLPVTAVGDELTRAYGPRALAMTATLVPERLLATAARPRVRRPARLLTVSRLEVEKNPLLLVEALALLERRRPGGQRLTWIGRGPLEPDVRARAAELRVAGLLELRGYVPFGEELLALYRESDVFVHVSLTEGVPQVLVEALCLATPVVATDVGGVAAALEGGAGVLVPPGDAEALAAALAGLLEDDDRRLRVAARGLEVARGLTIEAQSARVARYVAGGRASARARAVRAKSSS